MKKMFFLACCMFASMAAFAHDEIGVETTTFTPGDIKEVWVYLDCSTYGAQKIAAITLDVQFPEGWLVDTSAKNWGDGCMWNYKFNKQGTSINWAVSGSDKSDAEGDYVHFTLYASKTGNNFYPQSGRLFSFEVMAPDDVTPGFYPVKIRPTTTFAKDGVVANNITWDNVQTSYVKVGEPTKATFAPEGIVPAYVNEALASETAIAKLDLSKVTALNGDFTYVDGRDVVGTTATASVKYEGDKTGYYSVNVPFGAEVTGKVYKLTSTTAEYAHFDPVTSVEAGKTYLAEGKVTLAANAKVAGVAEQTGQTGNYVLNDTFYHGSNLTVPATRGLFEGASLSNLRVVVDGVLTNINVAQIEAGESAYDLQGRQTNNAKNGVFVVNGKKQFVK